MHDQIICVESFNRVHRQLESVRGEDFASGFVVGFCTSGHDPASQRNLDFCIKLDLIRTGRERSIAYLAGIEYGELALEEVIEFDRNTAREILEQFVPA